MDDLEKLAISYISISVKPNIPSNQGFRFKNTSNILISSQDKILEFKIRNEL